MSKSFFVLASFLLLTASCGIRTGSDVGEASPEEITLTVDDMLKIAKRRSCEKRLKDTYTFDSCISRIRPDFDALPIESKQKVSLHFVVYGKLDAGPAIVFYELISPCKPYIVSYLAGLSDEELREKLFLSKRKIAAYRENVESLMSVDVKRGDNHTGLPQQACEL